MKKLINTPAAYVDQAIDGLVALYPALRRGGATGRVVSHVVPPRARVGVVSGGGFGHLPLFTGYVGAGLLDACSIGNVFEGPTAASCEEAIRAAAAGGQGVLCLYGNYGGDRMNFDMACEMVALDGIATRTVLGTDDIASAPPDEADRRRGVAGIILAYKAAGAAAARGDSLDDVAAVAAHAVARTRTIGLALEPAQVPGADGPTFALGDDEVEMGMGIHGEPGIWRAPMRSADAFVAEMCDRLLAEAPATANTRVLPMINSLGATPLEELLILFRAVAERLQAEGIEMVAPMVGHFATSMEMKGVSLTFSWPDEVLDTLYAAPAECPFWTVR